MPVQKFHSIEEMNKASLPELYNSQFEHFLRLCASYRLISPERYPRGVFKFRNIEEAQQARAELLRVK